MEFILGLLVSWPVLMFIIFSALIAEHNEAHGWTVLFTLALAVISFSYFTFTWAQLGMLLAAWIPVGLVWSLWRWRRFCDRQVERARNGSISKENVRQLIDPQSAISTITQWVIAWPFSVLESLIGDVINMIQSLIKGVFRSTYERISAKALVKLEEIDD